MEKAEAARGAESRERRQASPHTWQPHSHGAGRHRGKAGAWVGPRLAGLVRLGQRCLHTTSLFFSACLGYFFSSLPISCWVPLSPSYSGTKLPHTESAQASLFSLQGFSPFCLITLVSSQSSLGFPLDSAGKESVCNAGDPGLIPGS